MAITRPEKNAESLTELIQTLRTGRVFSMTGAGLSAWAGYPVHSSSTSYDCGLQRGAYRHHRHAEATTATACVTAEQALRHGWNFEKDVDIDEYQKDEQRQFLDHIAGV